MPAARPNRWLVSEQLRHWVSTPLTFSIRQPDIQETTRASLSASQLQAAHIAARQLGAFQKKNSASTCDGLFAARQTCAESQDVLLVALDRHLTPGQQQQGEGAAGDGSISLEDLTKALGSWCVGKLQALTACRMSSTSVSGDSWDQSSPLCSRKPSSQAAQNSSRHMTMGQITLLYKGKGLDRALPASYRPITLLTTDYKLAARVMADRLGPLLNHVIDSTQTGFLPQRWIGDNILAHLEIIASYQRTQQLGILLFLDFLKKAFDRLDSPWLERCMAATGFGAGAQRWVRCLHAGTTAKVVFNGWHTQRFPVQSGIFQGSPLLLLLFAFAVQPISAHA